MSETLFADLVLGYLGRTVTMKGDSPGHPFRGNQYGEGQGGGSGDSGSSDGGSSGGGESARVRQEYESHPPIIKRAITEGVTDMGQLSKEDKKLLSNHVKKGSLIKVQNYHFPKPKPMYVPHPEYIKALNQAYNQ